MNAAPETGVRSRRWFRNPLVRAIVALAAITGLIVPLSAFQTWSGRTLIGGVYGRHYWIDGSVSSGLASYIYSAKWSWGNATTKVAWAETSSVGSSVMNFHQSSYTAAQLGYCGRTLFYTSNGTPTEPWNDGVNWTRTKVLFPGNFETTSLCPNELGIAIHEIGHVMGLAHSGAGATAIMRADIAGLTWQAPKNDDINGIAYLYP